MKCENCTCYNDGSDCVYEKNNFNRLENKWQRLKNVIDVGHSMMNIM